MGWSRKRWAERSFTLFVLILGIILGHGVDFWKTVWYVTSDIHAHVLDVTLEGDTAQIDVAFVNQGNRQGAITDVSMACPVSLGPGQAWFPANPVNFEITGVPSVLNPGDIRLVRVKGKVDVEMLLMNAETASAELDEPGFVGMCKTGFGLEIGALDFKGQKYVAMWNLGRMYFDANGAIAYYRLWPCAADLQVFTRRRFSPTDWRSTEFFNPPEKDIMKIRHANWPRASATESPRSFSP